MADTLTNALGLIKPEIGGSPDTWGNKFNSNLDAIDAIFAANGGGTAVGLNIGAGKTLYVNPTGQVLADGNVFLKKATLGPESWLNGTLTIADGTTITAGPSLVSPWVRTSEASTTGGTANAVPRASASGIFNFHGAPQGTWDGSGNGTFIVGNGNQFAPNPLRATEIGHTALVHGSNHGGWTWGAVWNNGQLVRTRLGRAWGCMATDDFMMFGASPDKTNAAGTPAALRWAVAFDYLGSMQTYISWGLSDIREKSELEVIEGALRKVQSLTGYTFGMHRERDRRHAGVIAQEVEAVLPEAVMVGAQERLVVNHAGVIALLVEAVKDLAARIETLEGLL